MNGCIVVINVTNTDPCKLLGVAHVLTATVVRQVFSDCLGVLGARRAQKCVWSRGPVRKIKWIVQVLAYAESYNKGF